MSGLFESISLNDDTARVANRRSAAVAHKRAQDQFGRFVANASPEDRASRLALIDDDLRQIVADVVTEHGGDALKVHTVVRASFEEYNDPDEDHGGKCEQHGRVDCPLCRGGNSKESGNADHLKEYQFKKKDEGAGDGDDDEDDEDSEPESEEESEEESEGVTASLHEARRPKMCPYHSEVVDISLGSGDPQAGFNAMTQHSWGSNHCKGGFEGACNFRPQMVTQKYWDDKQQEYAERRQERELAQQNKIVEPSLPSLQTEPVMTQEPLEHGEGEGITDIDAELADAPSAVGAPEQQMALAHTAADTPEGVGGAVTREKLPTGDESALGGPSPKIDKGNSGDEGGWSLEPIDTEMNGTRNPTEQQDITEKGDYTKSDFRDQADTKIKQEDLPSNTGDAGFDDGKVNKGPNTDTWSGTDGQVDPVSSDKAEGVLSSADPDKNPLREIIDTEFGGFVPSTQVEAAIRNFES